MIFMTILQELNAILDTLGVPVETGVFSGIAPNGEGEPKNIKAG